MSVQHHPSDVEYPWHVIESFGGPFNMRVEHRFPSEEAAQSFAAPSSGSSSAPSKNDSQRQ